MVSGVVSVMKEAMRTSPIPRIPPRASRYNMNTVNSNSFDMPRSVSPASTHSHRSSFSHSSVATGFSGFQKNNRLTTALEISRFHRNQSGVEVILFVDRIVTQKQFTFFNCLTKDRKRVVVKGESDEVHAIKNLTTEKCSFRITNLRAIYVQYKKNSDVEYDFELTEDSHVFPVDVSIPAIEITDCRDNLDTTVTVIGYVVSRIQQRSKWVTFTISNIYKDELIVRCKSRSALLRSIPPGDLKFQGKLILVDNDPVLVVESADDITDVD